MTFWSAKFAIVQASGVYFTLKSLLVISQVSKAFTVVQDGQSSSSSAG